MKRAFRILLSLPFLVLLSMLCLYAIGGFVVAPWWIKRELPGYLKTHLDASGSVGEISVNPFKLTLDVRQLAITERGGTTPAIAFDRLFVDFEASSLLRRAWTFAEITLEYPRLNLEVDANDTLNFSKLAPKKPAAKDEKSSTLPRLLLERVALKQGRVSFTDKGFGKPATARLDPIEFELHDLSTLPDLHGEYTLAARLPAGGTLGWRGTLSLAPFASSGRVDLKSVKLATLWQFVQDKLLLEEPGGSASLSLQYNARYGDGRLEASASDMALRVSDAALRQKSTAEPALVASEVALTGGTFNLTQRNMQFADLILRGITARTLLDSEGNANWSQFIPKSSDTPKSTPQHKPAGNQPWQFGIKAIQASDVRLGVIDHGFVRPIAFDIARANLQSSLKASFGDETTVTISAIGVELGDIHLAESGAKTSLLSLASAHLTGGNFDLGQKKFSADAIRLIKPVTAVTRETDGAVNLATAFARKQVKPPEPSTIVTEIQSIEVVDGTVSYLDRISEPPVAYEAQGLRVQARNVSTAAKATIPFEASLQIRQGGTLRAQGNVTPDPLRATVRIDGRGIALSPLAVLVEKLSALKLTSGVLNAAGQLDWNGQGNVPSVRYTGNAGIESLRFAHLATAASVPTGASAEPRGGAVRLQGTFSSAPLLAALKVEVRDIGLAPFAPLLARHAALKLASGSAHATGQFDFKGQTKEPVLRYTGNAGVDQFQLDLESNGEKLVGWKSLLAEGINFDGAGNLVRIEDIRVSAPSGKVAIAKDRSTNFGGMMRSTSSSTDAANKSAAIPAAGTKTTDTPFALTIERVHVAGGELDFADQSLVLPFAAIVRELNGTITGLSSQAGTRAGIKLEGRVDEFGQAQVGGTINPFEPKAFTDLAVTFRNVAMSPLTPYSATFAGRRIASGKLSLDLQYKLNKSQLQGENKVLLEQFTLGERVESPTAVSLPLDLAIALLTDSSGKIDLSIPVRGNVDQPDFAYGHLVWQAIRTVLTNIVTAPFRALASLLGGNAEKVDAIAFEAGSAQLAPPEREKLMKVSAVLKQRPQLRLQVEGRFDARHDAAALKAMATRRALAERQGIKLSGADDPAPVNFDNAKTQRALEGLLEQRTGDGGVEKFKIDYEKSSGKEAKRVNPALALVGKGSTDREFYEAIFKRVAELQPIAETTLRELAAQRSKVIAGYMMTNAGLNDARVGVKPVSSVTSEKAQEIASTLSLDAGK